MAQNRKKKKTIAKDIALERITYLFSAAGDAYPLDPMRSNRYASLARRIGMRYRVSIPSELKRKICKKCNSFLVPGSNCRVRLSDGSIIITCLNCGAIKRYPFCRN
ncbi:ribonuclease P protein component 4 [Methanolobus sp. ZRKC3]|uniref:ribonuclease P protein component 4 n=1 Tax=Methanolobus sp. ZRKC3 TaxID=3125786 RepID=UPI0032536FC0